MKSLTFLFFTLISCCMFSQSADEIMKSDLEKMKFVLMNKQFKIYSTFIYPKVIEMYGSQEKFIESIKENFEKDEKNGIRIKNIHFKNFNKSSFNDNEIQTSFTQVTISETPKGKVGEEFTIIGISNDNGKSWKFIDTSKYSGKEIKNLNYKSKIKYDLKDNDLKNKCLAFRNIELENISPFTFRKSTILISENEQKEISHENGGYTVANIIRDSINPCKMSFIAKEIQNKPNSKSKIGDTLHVEIVAFENDEYHFIIQKNNQSLVVPDKSRLVRKL